MPLSIFAEENTSQVCPRDPPNRRLCSSGLLWLCALSPLHAARCRTPRSALYG